MVVKYDDDNENDPRLLGTVQNDVLWAFNGNDLIYGLTGDDIIFKNTGTGEVFGGAGIDWLSFYYAPVGVNVSLEWGTAVSRSPETPLSLSISSI